ncbi:hypothetical protein [Cohnella thailandensis]|uniref:Uncharacterized protein n=1 Tax=Cohnella thailandensis TaxID=557557 RepID=A0A841T6E3_9BACL|nr:hypothetical protein [Cohnella thailandensis]MBB6637630.1 hypothetical protein [Cohnella thailandensis]MBP1974194.1 hypothetical protein [Cohnella thailandensis]
MKISENQLSHLPRIQIQKGDKEEAAAWKQGQLPVNRVYVDLLEISPEARELAAGDVQHREAYRYDSLPQRPEGAPDDYINMEDLFKRFQPESYEQFQSALKDNAADGLSLLLKFAQQVPKHPEWIETYREEMANAK